METGATPVLQAWHSPPAPVELNRQGLVLVDALALGIPG